MLPHTRSGAPAPGVGAPAPGGGAPAPKGGAPAPIGNAEFFRFLFNEGINRCPNCMLRFYHKLEREIRDKHNRGD